MFRFIFSEPSLIPVSDLISDLNFWEMRLISANGKRYFWWNLPFLITWILILLALTVNRLVFHVNGGQPRCVYVLTRSLTRRILRARINNTVVSTEKNASLICDTLCCLIYMGRQMYFYYLEWLFLYNQNNIGYLQITTLQFHYF